MDKHDRFIAINQTLPGLEEFLKVVLGSEPLSEDAERQRIEFLRRLESVSKPPSLPPRPANLSERYRARVQQNELNYSGSVLPAEESNVYKNERTLDPVEFASQQRELSRVANLYKTYAPQTVVLGEKGSKNGGLYFPRTGNTTFSRDNIRDSIQSTSSAEDDIYEHLKSISPSQPITPLEGVTELKNDETFAYPSPPKTPLEHTGTGIYMGARPGSFRASGGKGKISTGWFKREAKVYEEVYVSNLREPVIKGYLKDIKANKRRWCVLQGNRLHIFKTQDDPAIMIIDLLGCDIGVDDKKKISYSFRLTPKEGPGVSLAIEDGQDLSPWMSAIMAAVVRRGSVDRPISPLESAYSLEQARAEKATRGIEVDGGIEKEEADVNNFYEEPVDHDTSGTVTPVAFSTPTTNMESDDEEEDEGYDAPLPSLPIIDDYSSSESSSDEDESIEKKGPFEKAAAKKKIYDAIPADLLAELSGVKYSVVSATNKSQDSICEEASTNELSLELTDSHSEHSGNISNRHSYSEPLASDDTGSSEPKEDKADNFSRKRSSTTLSASMDSICSDTEENTRSRSLTSVSSRVLGPKMKRRKLVPAEAELQFLQDPTAMHSGILYQKRRLGVWSKRYCKIVNSRFKCYRNPTEHKPSLDFPILGYDISLIDGKDSKKSYCIKISHPNHETYFFATDSRISIERWIEVLSLAATGRLDVIAPYPPYFCAEQSGDELKSRSRESLLSSEGRLSDDESADNLDEMDVGERVGSLGRPQQMSEEQSDLPADESTTILPDDTSSVQTPTAKPEEDQSSEVLQSTEGEVKERVQKKRKEKPSDKDGTKTPSTMSPPHSMFISEAVDGQAKPEPMIEESVTQPINNAKDSPEDSSTKKDRRWAETLKKKKLARGNSYDYRLRGNIPTPAPPENAKNKHLSMKRKNSQTFSSLVKLFDKEGRFCGYLTEVRHNKFGTTHLRRWCVVKNGVLILYNSDSEDTAQGRLSLVDMWLTDKSEESRNKFAFSLEDKEGNATVLQTSVRDDYLKWMGVLELFTELRVERPMQEVAEPLRKTDSVTSEESDGSFERGTLKSKSMRAANKLIDEIYDALAPGKVRSSLRMKLSQRVNVRDMFRKTHNSYDLEGAATEGSSSSLPDTEIDTLAVFGGFLTQIEPDVSASQTGNSRWCTIKEKELLVFLNRQATDPIKKIPLMNSFVGDLSDDENCLNRFQIRHCNVSVVFEAWDKFDLNRWLQMLASVTERRNSSDDERPKCVGRLTSPTFAKKKIHRRTKSEDLQEDEKDATTTARRYTKPKDGSTSSVDRLMSGYLQEVREAHGARTFLRRWCVATSEKFIVYDNQNSKKASFEWDLSDMELHDQSDLDAGVFGFCVTLGEKKLSFKVIDEDSARHWLSVLARYCQAVPANQPSIKSPRKWRSISKEERRRSSSDNTLKTVKNTEKESNILEVLSEGRASGRKLVRRATEDSAFLRKFHRPEMFKAPWRASSEKLEVKMRERPGRSAANMAWKRFSCGSLFDSEGKYSGHLMELITSELYSSQVRRWCLQKDDYLYVYDNEASEHLIKVIPLFDAKVEDTSNYDACVYRFKIDYGDDNTVFFRALTRSDLEKWTTIISVKAAVLRDRNDRRLRRSLTLSLDSSTHDVTVSSESDVTSPDLQPPKSLTVDSPSLQETASLWSADSVFVRGISAEEGASTSSGLKPVDPIDKSSFSAFETNDEHSASAHLEDKTGLSGLNLVGPVDKSSFSCLEWKEEQSAPIHLEDDAGFSGSKPDDQADESTSSALEQNDDDPAPVQLEDNARDRTFSETESSDSNVKRVNRLSSIEDLSHMYENFLAFASAMAEKSPKFQEQLYHVYENVTQAFEFRTQNSAQKEEDLAEEDPGCSVDHETNVRNELGSPSMEMSSEFEKISLRDIERQESEYLYRPYSGICGESELEKLAERLGEEEEHGINTLAEIKDENSTEVDLRGCSLAGVTDNVTSTSVTALEGDSVKETVFVGEHRDLPHHTGELLGGVYKSETASENEDNVFEEAEVAETDVRVVNVENSFEAISYSESESHEGVCDTSTDVLESSSQTALQHENAEGNHGDDNKTVQSVPTLLHADYVSAVETGTSSFYLIQEVNDQVWSEVGSRVPSESVVETIVQVSATAESATDRDTSASYVGESAVDNADEEIAERSVAQEPTDGSQDCKDCEEQRFSSSGKDSMKVTACIEIQHLSEDNVLPRLTPNANEIVQSSLQLPSDKDNDIDSSESKDAHTSDLTPSSGNSCPKCGSIQNVCVADSFVTSEPLEFKCSMEVHSRQNILSTVCACKQAQVWDIAVTQVEESASVASQDHAREIQTFPEPENVASTRACDNLDTSGSEISNVPKRKVTDHSFDKDTLPLSYPSSGTNAQDSKPETADCETVTTNPVNNATGKNQAGVNTLEPCEQSEKIQSDSARSSPLDSCTYIDSSSDFPQDGNVPENSTGQDTECSTKSSSDEEFATPEDTINLSEENKDDSNSSFQDSRETTSAEPVDVLRSEIEDQTGQSSEGPCHDHLVLATNPESDSKNSQGDSSDSCKDSSNLEEKQDLTKSQMDILKAVTAAFEEILELHGDESDSDDTKL